MSNELVGAQPRGTPTILKVAQLHPHNGAEQRTRQGVEAEFTRTPPDYTREALHLEQAIHANSAVTILTTIPDITTFAPLSRSRPSFASSF